MNSLIKFFVLAYLLLFTISFQSKAQCTVAWDYICPSVIVKYTPEQFCTQGNIDYYVVAGGEKLDFDAAHVNVKWYNSGTVTAYGTKYSGETWVSDPLRAYLIDGAISQISCETQMYGGKTYPLGVTLIGNAVNGGQGVTRLWTLYKDATLSQKILSFNGDSFRPYVYYKTFIDSGYNLKVAGNFYLQASFCTCEYIGVTPKGQTITILPDPYSIADDDIKTEETTCSNSTNGKLIIKGISCDGNYITGKLSDSVFITISPGLYYDQIAKENLPVGDATELYIKEFPCTINLDFKPNHPDNKCSFQLERVIDGVNSGIIDKTHTFDIKAGPDLILDGEVTTSPACRNDNSIITLTPSNQTRAYRYTGPGSILGNIATVSIAQTGVGPYTFKIVDNDVPSCSVYTQPIHVPFPSEISVNDTTLTNPTCVGGDGTITISASGGTGTLKYSIGADVPSVSNSLTCKHGTHTVKIVDEKGCAKEISNLKIEDPSAISIVNMDVANDDNSFKTDPRSCSYPDGEISIQANGGAPGKNVIFSLYQNTVLPVNLKRTLSHTTGTDCSVSFGEFPLGLSEGNYVVTAYDGCRVVESSLITLSIPHPHSLNISTTDATCNSENGAFTLNSFVYNTTTYNKNSTLPAGFTFYTDYNLTTTAPYEYEGQAGAHTLSITHTPSGCSSINEDGNIGEPAVVNLRTPIIDSVRCYNQSNGSITISSLAGNTSVNSSRIYTIVDSDDNDIETITKSPGESAKFENLSAGTYSIEVTDGCNANGSDIETGIIVENYDEILATLTSEQMSCHDVEDGQIHVLASGGVGNLDFELNAIPGKITGTQNGTGFSHTFGLLKDETLYKVTVYDVNNCSNTFDADPIINPPSLEVTSDILKHISCYDGNDGAIAIAAKGGTGEISFSLDNTSYSIGSYKNPEYAHLFADLSAGNYNVYIKDVNSCLLLHHDTIKQPLEYKVSSLTTTSTICHGGSDGSLSISATGGTPNVSNYTYQLLNVDKQHLDSIIKPTANFTGQPSGKYYVNIFDNRRCLLGPIDKIIGQPDEIVISPTISAASCYDDQDITLTANVLGGTPPFEFVWKDIYDKIIGNTSAIHVAKGMYFVELVDKHNCGYGKSVPNIGSFRLPFVAQIPDTLKLKIDKQQNVDFYGLSNASVSLLSDGGWSFHQYSMDAIKYQNSSVFSGLSIGNYKFYVKDSSNCNYFITTSITQPDPFITSLNSKKDVNCLNGTDGQIKINAQGGIEPFTYLLDNGKGTVITQNNNNFNKLPAGNYTPKVSYSGHNGVNTYTNTLDNIFISQPTSAITSEITEFQNPNCTLSDGWAKVTANGGTSPYTYLWKDSQITDKAINLHSGDNYVVVSDLHHCTDTSIITLFDNGGPMLGISKIDNLPCFNSADLGSATLSVSGYLGSYDIQWNDPAKQKGLIASGLATGVYSAQVTDSRNCISKLDGIKISRPEPLFAVLDDFKDPTCFNDANGSIKALGSGGSPPYQFKWQTIANAGNINIATELKAGKYPLLLTDKNNCTSIDTFELKNPEEIAIPIADSIFVCEAQTAALDAGNPYYNHSWVFGNNLQSDKQVLFAQTQGDYTITITNTFGCTKSKTIHLKHENRTIDASFIVSSQATMADTVVAIEISWPMPDSIQWFVPNNFNIINDLDYYKELIPKQTGEFTIGVKAYLSGCSDFIEKKITILPANKNTKNSEEHVDLIRSAKLFPNPTTGNFQVEVELSRLADIQADIFSIKGLKIAPTKFDNGKNTYLFDFNLIRLEPGIYFVNVMAEKEMRKLKFIVE